MIVSLNWIKKFTDVSLSVEELTARIGERLVEIEEVIDLSAKYKGVLIARVMTCEKLEGSDHLNVTTIDDGGVAESVERNEHGHVQVVCGAPNVTAGMLVAWLPPTSTVPSTYGTDEPFVLSAKPLRGVVSNGMLASAQELALYDDHSGILEVDIDAAPGTPFAEVYELDDYLLDIENKSLTHRPDTFGVIGFAREIAGIQGLPFRTPEWLQDVAPLITASESIEAPHIEIVDPALSDRFQAIVLTNINEAASSPVLLQTYLARSGVRPINLSVDVSNYLMLLTGQPSHAYDYDLLRTVAGDDFTVRVRTARENEKLVLLDGKEVSLDPSDIVIAAGDTAVGLAGIMGGKSTATHPGTKTVLLEVATFDLYHLRTSQMRHGIFSEAVTRFTKGIPADLSQPVLVQAADMLAQNSSAVVASPITEAYPGKREPIHVQVVTSRVNELLGTMFATEDLVELLANVGFVTTLTDHELDVEVPYWRNDIHIAEDVIEEIGRLAGFDTIPPTLPRRFVDAVQPSAFDQLRSALRQRLVRAGANEVLTYSFVHVDKLRKANQDPSDAYAITNSLSPDLQRYRLSIVPSLLGLVHPNSKAGFDHFALFECNKVHAKSAGMTVESVPLEFDRIGFVVSSTKTNATSPYYEAKAQLEYMLAGVGVEPNYIPLSLATSMTAPFEPKRSAEVYDQSGLLIGVVGELRGSVRKQYKLPEYTAAFEIDPRAVLRTVESLESSYTPSSRFPGTERDICFQVPREITYAQVFEAAKQALQDFEGITDISPVDLYQPSDSKVKNITINIKIASYRQTVTSEDVGSVVDSVIEKVTSATQGKVV